jgi:AcrR family transcriptional regulator
MSNGNAATSGGTATGDATTEAILDATRTSVLDFGIRRTTLTDVARRAGVSRMTVYRRYPDVDAVLRDLMTREFGRLMEELAASGSGADGRARVVARLSAGVRALRAHPLMRKVMEAEPELLLPYVLGRMGETQRRAVAMIAHDVAAAQEDGSARPGDPRLLAQSLLLLAQSFVLSAGIAEDVDEEALLTELEGLVDASLRPVP